MNLQRSRANKSELEIRREKIGQWDDQSKKYSIWELEVPERGNWICTEGWLSGIESRTLPTTKGHQCPTLWVGLTECPHRWAHHCENIRKVGTMGQSYQFLERKKYITTDKESAWFQVACFMRSKTTRAVPSKSWRNRISSYGFYTQPNYRPSSK